MKTIRQEEPVARSLFVECPSCKTHTLKLARVVQSGRCKSCHESYKIIVLYVREGKKAKAPTKQAPTNTQRSPEPTLPSWQMPSDSSLFGSVPADSASIFSDTNTDSGSGSFFGPDDEGKGTSTGSEQ